MGKCTSHRALFGMRFSEADFYRKHKRIWQPDSKKMRFANHRDRQQFLMDFRSRFGTIVQDVETLSIFEEHKFTYWPD